MSYLTPRSSEPLRSELLLMLADMAGITVEADDLPRLAVALADQFASIEVLDSVDLDDFNPIVEFDPRWHARTA
jgi:hypothetical protein